MTTRLLHEELKKEAQVQRKDVQLWLHVCPKLLTTCQLTRSKPLRNMKKKTCITTTRKLGTRQGMSKEADKFESKGPHERDEYFCGTSFLCNTKCFRE